MRERGGLAGRAALAASYDQREEARDPVGAAKARPAAWPQQDRAAARQRASSAAGRLRKKVRTVREPVEIVDPSDRHGGESAGPSRSTSAR